MPVAASNMIQQLLNQRSNSNHQALNYFEILLTKESMESIYDLYEVQLRRIKTLPELLSSYSWFMRLPQIAYEQSYQLTYVLFIQNYPEAIDALIATNPELQIDILSAEHL